jgi:hypothetical protein
VGADGIYSIGEGNPEIKGERPIGKLKYELAPNNIRLKHHLTFRVVSLPLGPVYDYR